MKNSVMNAKTDPKVVMDLSIFKIGGWNRMQPIHQILLEEIIEENERWLMIGIPSRDPFFLSQYLERHSVSSDQHMKKLMSPREGLHVMMQCYMRQHFADRSWLHEHPGGPCIVETTYDEEIHQRINKLLGERTVYADGMFRRCDQNRVSMFGSDFEEHALEVCERNWMNPEMQTTLLNTYPPKLIATILKALREQLKENDQLHSVEEIAGPVPEIALEYDQILKGGGGRFWDDVNGG